MKIIYHITLTIPPIIQFHLKGCFIKIKENAYTQFDSRKQVLHSRMKVIGNSNKKRWVSSFDPPPANNLSLCLAMRSTAT